MKALLYSSIVAFLCSSTGHHRTQESWPSALIDSISLAEHPKIELDKINDLLEISWSGVIEGAEEDFFKKMLPKVENGILFPGLHSNFVFNALNGERLYYTVASDRKFIREKLSDSLMCFYNNEKVTIVNLFSGKVLRKYKQKAFTRFATQPTLLRSNTFPVIKKDVISLYSIYEEDAISSYPSFSSVSGNFLWANNDFIFSNEESILFVDDQGGALIVLQ